MRFAITVALLFIAVICGTCSGYEWDSPWTYSCVEDTIDGPACERQEWNKSTGLRTPLSVCILTCGSYGSLWPYPNGPISRQGGTVPFELTSFLLDTVMAPTDQLQNWLQRTTEIGVEHFLAMRKEYDGESGSSPNLVKVSLEVATDVSKFALGVDESYEIDIKTETSGGQKTVFVKISGETYFGVKHGIETLTQLIAFDEERGLYQIVEGISFKDGPTFRYRGLSMDTARNFIPMDYLRRMVDGLSYNKMNILHWHISDSNSFPFESKRVPQVTRYGIHSSKKVYSEQDVKDLVEYANFRGVKIIPELDAPSHAGMSIGECGIDQEIGFNCGMPTGNGWQWGPMEGLGELSLCINAQPYKSYCIQPPCGQLNPLNNNTYMVLGELYKDFLDVFDRDIFHMGGDEISYKCWQSSEEIMAWLAANNAEMLDLWGIYQETAWKKLQEATSGPRTPIVWTSEMTDTAKGRTFLDPKHYIIQVWSTTNDPVIGQLLRENYTVFFSNNDTVYLDHGFGAWRGTQNKATLKSWQNIYENDILSMVKNLIGETEAENLLSNGKLLGGEATLWAEKSDISNMEMKLWPRGSAYAERLWSNPPITRTRFAYPRLIHHRERLVQRGIQADTLVPESCYNIWGFCDDPDP